MNTQKRLELIKKDVDEILVENELKYLLEQGVKLNHYIGFEISGFVHLGTGIQSMKKVRDFQKAGVNCSIFLADWHSWINNKLGGDMEKIRKIAGGYFKEALKTSLKCVGGNPDKVKFVLGSDLYHNNDNYWQTMIEISKEITLSRVQRSITIMGRKEGEAINFAQLIYPPMQSADIFTQNINLAHAGSDQRSAHVIAREVALKLKTQPLIYKNKKYKPITIHHHLILGLQKPQTWPIDKNKIREIWSSMKMSKSIPKSAVFIHDSPNEIKEKLNSAFCPVKEITFNPVLDWVKHLVFLDDNSTFKIEREKKYGGDIIFENYNELEKQYSKGDIHPQDLKNATANSLIKILEPARKHFSQPKNKKLLDELNHLTITR
ncbi:MAG: tyrosine--tRNA ligase [Nanoarchaeota archaeon]|nr:tyrosine--tRNA ligase [Nanoarchaeota archaeon]